MGQHAPTWEHDVKVVDILKINMHLLCKILGCRDQYNLYNTEGVYSTKKYLVKV
jgi:hypothetical protein